MRLTSGIAFIEVPSPATRLPGAFFLTVCNPAAQISLVEFPHSGLELPRRFLAFRFLLFYQTGT